MRYLKILIGSYALISFIEWDIICLNWKAFTTIEGRLILTIYFILVLDYIVKNAYGKFQVINQQSNNNNSSEKQK